MEDENRKIEVDSFKVSQGIEEKKKGFIIKYLVFILILTIFTVIAIFIKVDKINKENASKNISSQEIKTSSDDEKYLIDSYVDTYKDNSIEIIKYYDKDGKVSNNYNEISEYYSMVEYVQIQGLKDKKIQNSINQRIKDMVYSIKKQNVYTSVTANFSNILSIISYNDENKVKTLNIDLSTGKDIKLEDLFLPSTPINSYLANTLYETIAWQSFSMDEEDGSDMSKVDMSDFEDKALMLINNYKKKKDNLTYNITANSVMIYNLLDKNIIDSEYADTFSIILDLTEYTDNVTMFKKFITNESIYENDSIGDKETIVFTVNDEFDVRLNYGKLTDTLFMEEVVLDYEDNFYENNELKIAREFIQKMSKENRENMIKNSKSNRGVFFQREYQTWYDEEKEYTVVNVATYQATCSASYFQNDAFHDYIILKDMPRGDAVLQGFYPYMSDKFPELSISEIKYDVYFLDKKGEIIATSYEELEEKTKKEQMKNEEKNETNNTINNNKNDVQNKIENGLNKVNNFVNQILDVIH